MCRGERQIHKGLKSSLGERPYYDILWTECCVPPKFTYWNSNPQSDGIRRWGFGEVIRLLGGAIMNGISAFRRETESFLYLSSPPVRVQWKESPHQTLDLPVPWSWTSLPPELQEINICCLSHTDMVFCYNGLNRPTQNIRRIGMVPTKIF